MARQNNLLRLKPKPCEHVTLEMREGKHFLVVHHNGIVSRLCTRLFRRPERTYIELDELGVFVWQRCDGATDIQAIAGDMSARFGERAEPVLGRLVQFVRILVNNRLITLEQ